MGYSADPAELRQEFADDTAEWTDIRKEAQTDMRHVAGDPWEPEDRKAREDAGRPCVVLDELGQYVNQVVNEVRANKRAVKFAPVGNGADEDTADFYADKMREIEYRSRASIAYTTAFENSVQRSYGFCRVNTRYESARSINQDIWIDPVHNPDLITPDPFAQMPDFSDQKRCWVREPWTIEDFNARWKGQKLEGRVHQDAMREHSTWISARQVWVSEAWKIVTKPRRLLIMQVAAPQQPGNVLNLQQPGPSQTIAMFEDEAKGRPLPGQVVRERMVDDPTVYQCLTNGVDILEENPWLGKYIPIIGCLGKVLYVDNGEGAKRQIHSMVRLARGPFMGYCFYRTCELENVGMTTKNPYWAYAGQLTPQQKLEIAKSLHEPVAVLEAKATTTESGQNILPLPVRNVSEPAIQALSMGAEEMRRAIQAAFAQSPLPTMAQRRNEKSGVALKHIEETGQRGSYHFTDHYIDMVTQVGIVCEDLMDKVYDTARQVGIRKANDTAETIWINDPQQPKGLKSTKGDHLVTVSTGPSFESEREEARDYAERLAQVSPEAFMALGPIITKLSISGPVADELMELQEALQPPPVQALRDSKKQGDPAQAAQQLVAAKAQMQQLEQVAQQMKQQLDTDAAKQQATIEKAKIDGDIQVQLQIMRDATAITVAKINAEAKAVQHADEADDERIALGLTQAHESHEADLDRQAAAAMAQQAHQQALEAGDVEHGQDMEAGEQSHQQALEQGDQGIAGSLAVQAAKPAPTNGASA